MARKHHAAPWLLTRGDRATLQARIAAGRSPLHRRTAALLQRGGPTGRYNSGEYLWRRFCEFCACKGRRSLPATPSTVAAYLLYRRDAGLALTPSRLALCAIRRMHRCTGAPDPTRTPLVRATLAGLQRQLGTAPLRYKACRLPMLRRLIAATPGQNIRAVRDRAMLMLLYFAPLQTYEFTQLTYEQLAFTECGVLLRDVGLRHKRSVAVWQGRDPEFCPVRALEAWIAISGVRSGPLFRGIYGEMRKWGKGVGHSYKAHTYKLSPQLTQTALDEAVSNAFERIGIHKGNGFCVHSFHLGFMLDALGAGMEWTAIGVRVGYKTFVHLRRLLMRLGVPAGDLPVRGLRGFDRWAHRRHRRRSSPLP